MVPRPAGRNRREKKLKNKSSSNGNNLTEAAYHEKNIVFRGNSGFPVWHFPGRRPAARPAAGPAAIEQRGKRNEPAVHRHPKPLYCTGSKCHMRSGKRGSPVRRDPERNGKT